MACALWSAPALSQSTDVQPLLQRLDRLERDLKDIQRAVYRGEKPPTPKPGAGAPAKDKPVGTGRLVDAEIRLSRLQSDMRSLTGQLEEVQHGIRTVRNRLDALVKDVDFRLGELERRMAAMAKPATPAEQAAATAGAEAEGGKPAAAPAGDGQATPAKVAKASVLPDGSPMERYKYAYSLLVKLRFDEAEVAFQEFLAAHAEDKLAGNAQYWLGETYYTRNKLQEAARAFLEGVRRYPDSNKAPDTILKLAITLRKLGQREEACSALSELQDRFPDPTARLRRLMQNELKAATCG
jgi:tol-pal system protein YbgF